MRRGLIRPGLLASIVVPMVMGFGQATAHAAVVDAQCPGPADAFFIKLGINRQAETFTVINTGVLTQAQLEIDRTNAGGDFQLQILATDGAGTPVNGILASATIPDASLPLGVTTLVGNFNPGLTVQSGRRLALVVTRPGGSQYHVLLRSADPCPGSNFFSNTQTDVWNPDVPGTDLVFQTMVNPTNAFTIGKLKGRKLTLNVPGKGAIAVADATASRSASAVAAKAKKLLKPSQATASGPGAVTVKLRLTKAAQRLLQRNGKLKARAAITFTPTGGDPNTLRAKLKIKR